MWGPTRLAALSRALRNYARALAARRIRFSVQGSMFGRQCKLPVSGAYRREVEARACQAASQGKPTRSSAR